MAKLLLLQGGEATPYEIAGAEAVLGRHPECSIQINSNMVSRKHARVFAQEDAFVIEDLGSGNGTFVNGKKLEGPSKLKDGDRIKLGPILLRFEDPNNPASRPVVAPGSGVGAQGGSAGMATFNLEFATGDDDVATVMGTSGKVEGFGALEVQPEAKLKAVLEISRALAGSTDLDSLLPKILDTLFNIFPHADRGVVLFKSDDGKLVPRAIKHRRADEDESVKLSRTVLNTVLEQKTGILSADATNDSRFEASESISALTIRSMMAVPMLSVAGEVMGVIHIDTQNAFNQFKKDDLDLLIAVAGQAGLSYETARLMVTALEKQKQDREMQIAANVQLALLPESLPQIDGYQFYASYDSAQAVGGDYYDCMELDGDRVFFAFGDVAGKGVPASLVMSRISSVVQNVMAYVTDVGVAVTRINNQMCAKAVEGRFVTFVLGVISIKTGEMSLVNAGHMPVMIRKADGTVEEFGAEAVGIPLGVMEDYPFDVVKRVIEPGETCLIYTDGVSEAMNHDSDLYGMTRIRDLMVSHGHLGAEDLGRTILQDVRKHANGRPQNDDITLMLFGRLA
ncbi:MAG: stage II sporulation protein E [Planctomyces sp.]|nr:stage II sporulation protein E [Planctomyces sp.]